MTPLFDRLFSFVRLTLERQSGAASPPRQISHERQWGISTDPYTSESFISSWIGNGEPNEVLIITSFSNSLGFSGRRHNLTEFQQQIENILETRQTWIGQLSHNDESVESCLLFMTPAREFAKVAASGIDRTQELSDDGVTSPLQLVCLHHRALQDRRSHVRETAVSTPEVVVLFEISSSLVKALFAKSIQLRSWERNYHRSWLGSLAAADLESCVQAILEELWEDVRHQLDAWQQLYALACVKAHVRLIRRMRDPEDQL